jgi:hypothetical protein
MIIKEQKHHLESPHITRNKYNKIKGNMAGLHVDDINLIKQVIEIASTRGAFQAGELKAVGEVYDKVTAFLAEIEDNQKKADEAQQGAPDTPPEEQPPTEPVEVVEDTNPS